MKQSLFTVLTISCLLTLLYSCGESKSKQIVGKWEYVRLEKRAGSASDEEIKALNERNKGGQAIFNEDGSFISRQGENESKGTYELIRNGDYVITKMSTQSRGDTIRIVELTNNSFKLETEERDVIVLKRLE